MNDYTFPMTFLKTYKGRYRGVDIYTRDKVLTCIADKPSIEYVVCDTGKTPMSSVGGVGQPTETNYFRSLAAAEFMGDIS